MTFDINPLYNNRYRHGQNILSNERLGNGMVLEFTVTTEKLTESDLVN